MIDDWVGILLGRRQVEEIWALRCLHFFPILFLELAETFLSLIHPLVREFLQCKIMH
jgi:hypothetical protein